MKEEMRDESVQPITEEDRVKTQVERFDPVISKITKPLKPQGVRAGVMVTVKGNF
jgi:hypothetical protein